MITTIRIFLAIEFIVNNVICNNIVLCKVLKYNNDDNNTFNFESVNNNSNYDSNFDKNINIKVLFCCCYSRYAYLFFRRLAQSSFFYKANCGLTAEHS